MFPAEPLSNRFLGFGIGSHVFVVFLSGVLSPWTSLGVFFQHCYGRPGALWAWWKAARAQLGKGRERTFWGFNGHRMNCVYIIWWYSEQLAVTIYAANSRCLFSEKKHINICGWFPLDKHWQSPPTTGPTWFQYTTFPRAGGRYFFLLFLSHHQKAIDMVETVIGSPCHVAQELFGCLGIRIGWTDGFPEEPLFGGKIGIS